MITRTIMGVDFDVASPSVLHMADAPVTIAFDGRRWQLSMLWRGARTSTDFASRDEAVRIVAENYRKERRG